MIHPTQQHDRSHFAELARNDVQLQNLSAEDQQRARLYLRDQHVARYLHKQPMDDEALCQTLLAALHPAAECSVLGLQISFHPTARLRMLRVLSEELIPTEIRSLCVQAAEALPQLRIVFVDPEELSYRSFENIIPLDRYFDQAPLSLQLTQRKKLQPSGQSHSFQLEASAETKRALEGIDALDLYVKPLNASTRGGERFIFHSAKLSEVLTQAVRSALPKRLLTGFSHVNPVFRCNRFEPGDDKFHRHVDTPYFDAAQHHVSRYTLILYLTGGAANPALSIGTEVALQTISPMTCVIFDQSLAHEGSAYQEGRKVFLRTELVFVDKTVRHDPDIAQLFAKACYLTGQSLFLPELSRTADDYYQRAARAHFAGLSDEDRNTNTVLIHKVFRGIHFVTNGYDFWFPKGHLSLTECAVLALLDSFNCKLHGAAFHTLCRSSVLETADRSDPWITQFLIRQSQNERSEAEPLCSVLDEESLFPSAESPSGCCCPFHSFMRFDASRCEEIIDLYQRAQQFAKSRIQSAPIVLLGQQIFLHPERFVIEPGRIHILSEDRLAPVNFAACWNFGGSPDNYIDVAAKVEVLQPLVPPILYVETEGSFHLMFDFFRNSFLTKLHQYEVPVPFISDVDPGDAEENGKTPWITAAKRARQRFRKQSGSESTWWADSDAPLMSELFPTKSAKS